MLDCVATLRTDSTRCAELDKRSKKGPAKGRSFRIANCERDYFLPAAAGTLAYFFWKRSTRPAVSTSFCLPVKNGWQLEQISTRSILPLMVERVWKVFPQAQWTVTG